MEQSTGKQYMISALKRLYSDRVPVSILCGPYCSREAGYSVSEILKDAKKSAAAHLAFFDRFQPDSLVVYNDIYLELEAMGCDLIFPDANISHVKSTMLEDQSQLADLKVPDPAKDGRLPYFFEVCERVSSAVRKTATMGLGHSGPWNLALHLRGAERLLVEVVTDPDFVHELMTFTTEVVRSMGDALIEAGFSPSLGEASASCSLISPKIYKEFIKPYHKTLCEYFKTKKAFMSLHVCGFIDPIMEDILDTGVGFISLDAPSSLEKLVSLSRGDVAIMGNVSTALFASGTQEEMEKEIDDCIETAAARSGFVLCSGCEIPLNATQDRIDHYFNYGRQAGRSFMASLKEQDPDRFVRS